MRFPPSFIERLRSHFLMSDLIGKRIAIKKHGREYHALCPFHNEKTPSFTINDEKGFFHCFGCGAHGDAIGFVMDYEKLTYPEAIERLARDAGIALPQVTPEEIKKFEREKTLLGVLEEAAVWFEQQLQASAGMSAREYVQKRGLKPETIQRFRIGYAPDSRTALHQHLEKAGFPKALQAEAGLIIITDDGSTYDRFRGRVMFPIRNASGKVVAFGGRIMPGADPEKKLAKYLNSPETPLFKKGELLYNLDLARRPARMKDLTVVMEGYMDVVATAQSGIDYAVATLGTAVTPEHLRLLWQLAKEPVLCLDGDEAGKRAMMRGAEIALPLLKPGYSLRFATLPAGDDPDSYVNKHGKAAFEKILTGASVLSQVVWEGLASQFKLTQPEGRAALEDASKQICNKIADPTVKAHYLSHFKKMLWDKTRDAAPAVQKTPYKGPFKPGQPKPITNERSHHITQLASGPGTHALSKLTERLLRTVLAFPLLLHKGQVEDALSRLEIENEGLASLRDMLLDAGHLEGDDEALAAHVKSRTTEEMKAALPGPDFSHKHQLTFEDALALWTETQSAYEDERESAHLEQILQQDWNEADYARLSELKKKQAARTSGLPTPDAA